jgi:surfeit locus 1 family protein
VLGWSRSPEPAQWPGGEVAGVLLAQPKGKFDIIADPPLAGLEANARPDPADIPNNHLAYAVQWFLFAGVALVIYALALRKRMRAG